MEKDATKIFEGKKTRITAADLFSIDKQMIEIIEE